MSFLLCGNDETQTQNPQILIGKSNRTGLYGQNDDFAQEIKEFSVWISSISCIFANKGKGQIPKRAFQENKAR